MPAIIRYCHLHNSFWRFDDLIFYDGGGTLHNSGVSETSLTRMERSNQNLKVVQCNIGNKVGATSDNFSTTDLQDPTIWIIAANARKSKIQPSKYDWSGRLDKGAGLSIRQSISLANGYPIQDKIRENQKKVSLYPI